MDSRFELKWLTKAFERLSKRLRFLETLPRPSSTVVDTFLELTDTPVVYTGYGGFAVFVNPAEDGLRFDPVGGGACVAFTCGPVGWRGTGGTVPRTLVHEVAFQLDTGGDNRGTYAVDLQQERNAVDQVAGGEYSAILGGQRNEIGVGAIWSTITGSYNTILDTSAGCHILGQFTDIYDDSYGVIALGDGHDISDCDYSFFAGLNHEVDQALGVFAIMDGNRIIENVEDGPVYSGAIGISCLLEGDVWFSFQFGEQNEMIGSGVGADDTVLWCAQFGFDNYLENVYTNFAFGQGTKSYRPTADGFYDGRILNSGDYPNKNVTSDPTGHVGGFNQDSRFSQNDLITNWTVAWISSRFQFPIIPDSIWCFTARIGGAEQGCANVYDWRIRGMVKNDGGTTTIKWSIVDNYYRDVVTKEWQVIADDPNDRLVFQFRDTAGPDTTDCNIQFSMDTVEVGWEA
ncbi:hypothetical protein LCGC14_0955810 [marine sediment metagenome]|uniref:Uncharacterized protein n=1 Tax=marine sediment metagenome TaxID=412755 RepID=A0A0F9RMD0_9ZZZZ